MKIPVVEVTTDKSETRGNPKYADCRQLPPSYMSEYSVMGLVVEDIDRAVDILTDKGFKITREIFGAEAEIQESTQLPDMIRILEAAGVYGSIGDVRDSVYQG